MSKRSIFNYKLPPYNSPLIQVIIVSLVCFCCPGMFNVINSMGAGGQLTSSVGQKANIALYSCFSVFGILAGGIHNILGTRITLFTGGLTYPLYAASFLSYNHNKSEFFVIFAGCLLGCGAALLWTAQGTILMSYPDERHKGRYISLFWIIFNLGSVLGGLIPFGMNYHSTVNSLNDGTYIAFIIIMVCGALCGLAILPAHRVVRSDNSVVTTETHRTVPQEAISLVKLFADPKILLLAPMFTYSNWFYGYQFTAYNGFLFTVRTTAFNTIWYFAAQMLSSYVIGAFLDSPFLSKRKRGVISLILIVAMFSVVWGGALAKQVQYTRHTTPAHTVDFTDTKSGLYGPLVLLYIFFGSMDAIYQTWAYWIMGAISSNPSLLSRYSGFYKGTQSAGNAISWALDVHNVSYLGQLIVNWSLLLFAFPFALIVAFGVHEHVEDSTEHQMPKENLAFGVDEPAFEGEKLAISDYQKGEGQQKNG